MLDNPIIFGGLFFLIVILYVRRARSIPAPYPPGPKAWPIIGNALDMPRSRPWATFSKWGEIYGGIVRVTVLDKSLIVINEVDCAIDLLDKKSRIYSDRPPLEVAGKMAGWDITPSLINADNTFREFRRYYAKYLGSRAKVYELEESLRSESSVFLQNMLQDPTAFAKHADRYATGMMLMTLYGYKRIEENDPIVGLLGEVGAQLGVTLSTSALAVNFFPILRYLPAWLYGGVWKYNMANYRESLKTVMDVPYNWVVGQVAAKSARPSFLANLLGEGQVTGDEEFTYKLAVSGLFTGGTDPIGAGVCLFIREMTLHTAALKKAQAEVEEVVGHSRLPTLSDREHLPYCDALLSEVLRVHPLGPLALPHASNEDDVHDGYYIPKGSIIIPNVWQMCKDPKAYENPEKFYPERFLEWEGHAPEKDPRKLIFGFGRRTCPGNRLADAALWLVCISTIATFDIRPPVKDGKPVLPSRDYLSGLIIRPKPFECVITPRPEAVSLITRSA